MTKEANGNPEVLYTVTVSQTIATIVQDEYSTNEHPPLKLAFMALSDYFADNASDEHNQFSFTIQPTGIDKPIKIEVSD